MQPSDFSSPVRPLTTHCPGFPRIGPDRELKRAVEGYWRGALNAEELEAAAREVRAVNRRLQRAAGIDLPASNDFSLYDHILDMSVLAGCVPERFAGIGNDLDLYFAIARGAGAPASPMVKWFDTNYHYIAPELRPDLRFRRCGNKPVAEFAEALAEGCLTKPVIPGPVTWLACGQADAGGFNRWSLLPRLLPVYAEILGDLAACGAKWVQFDEPVLALDPDPEIKRRMAEAYEVLREAAGPLKIMVACGIGAPGPNFLTLARLPVDAIHLDAIRGAGDLQYGLDLVPGERIVSLGVVDARNVWRNDYRRSLEVIDRVTGRLGRDRVWLATSGSLLHVPVSLEGGQGLDPALRRRLAFAVEKLREVTALARLAVDPDRESHPEWLENQEAIRGSGDGRPGSGRVRERLDRLRPEDYRRPVPHPERRELQRKALGLPLFPATTIGSFPQTAAVREWRARWRRGELPEPEYEARIRREMESCIRFQEEIGIDVAVHGEFERTDMVEYFGEQLEGIAFTSAGWVQSYGTRCVKPPIIFGDVHRPQPMTVRWWSFAQSLTRLPVKGMLTGPVTILNWSFVRDDLPRRDVCRQIALAIRDEVMDLEAAGAGIIQIDEAALREGLPLRRGDQAEYLSWAVEAFRLCSSGVRATTQVHTHMCYSRFREILPAIAEMDADVVTIETSRSNRELLEAMQGIRWPCEIGPGVYDIHSPRVPGVEEILGILREALRVMPAGRLWVNPDCGLKTRGWPEVSAALRNMMQAVAMLRAEYARTAEAGENRDSSPHSGDAAELRPVREAEADLDPPVIRPGRRPLLAVEDQDPPGDEDVVERKAEHRPADG